MDQLLIKIILSFCWFRLKLSKKLKIIQYSCLEDFYGSNHRPI